MPDMDKYEKFLRGPMNARFLWNVNKDGHHQFPNLDGGK